MEWLWKFCAYGNRRRFFNLSFINITLDGSVTVQSIEIGPGSSFDAGIGNYTLTLTAASTTANPIDQKPLGNRTTFVAGNSTVKLQPTGGDHVEIGGGVVARQLSITT